MGNSSSGEESPGNVSPNIMSKIAVKGSKADMDAFWAEGRVNNVRIAYITKKQHERFIPRNINRKVELTHAMIKGVKRNWAMISEGSNAQGSFNGAMTPLVVLYDTFFGRLFMLEPSMRVMFQENMIRQSKFLVGLVNMMVKMEDHLKEGLAPVFSFADRGVAIGTRPEHFESIAEVLPAALKACAEEGVWTTAVDRAWHDVISFALLAVVERSVESWGNLHGTGLSEMWNALSDWRSKRDKSKGNVRHVPGGDKAIAKVNKTTSAAAISMLSPDPSSPPMTSNEPGRPPELPAHSNHKEVDDAAQQLYKKGVRSLPLRRRISSIGATSVSSMDADQGVPWDEDGDGEGDGGASSAQVSPVTVSNVEGGVGGKSKEGEEGVTRGGDTGEDEINSSLGQAMESLGLSEQAAAEGFVEGGGVAGVHPLRVVRSGGEHARRSSDMSIGIGSHHSLPSLGSSAGSDVRQQTQQWPPFSVSAGPGGARRAGGSDGSASSTPVHRTGGMSRSSLNLLRRKKIIRSASLEDDDERRRAFELGAVGGRTAGGSGQGSEVLGGVSGNGAARARGREGNLALNAGLARSQSVSDEVLPGDGGNLEGGEFETQVEVTGGEVRLRRKGLVSRMRRTASSVIRHPFRSSSRSESVGDDQTLGLNGNSRSPSGRIGGSTGNINGIAEAAREGSVAGESGNGGPGRGSRAGTTDGVPSLKVSSASPGSASTAIPTPATATPASDGGRGTQGARGGGGKSGARVAESTSSGPKPKASPEVQPAKGTFHFSNQDAARGPRRSNDKQKQKQKPQGTDNAGQGSDNAAIAEACATEEVPGGRGGGGEVAEESERINPWKRMKLHELMAMMEDCSPAEAEENFTNIGDAILFHLKPSEAPTTRALALDVAQTFVQNVLSKRSKDKQSSKNRRRAFKELLSHLIPLMLDCLKSPGGSTSTSDQSPALVDSLAFAGALQSGEGGGGEADDEVDVLQYYQQHHQYLLRVAALEILNRFLTVLRALFRPPQSTRVQKVVAPLLDAPEEVLREKAAAVLGKLSLCGRDTLKWANIAIKVSLEAHNLLQDAWPDEIAGQIPSEQMESIMGDHPLLPPIQDTYRNRTPEAQVLAIGRRFPALCKLLATLVTASSPKAQEPELPEDGGQNEGNNQANGAGSRPFQIPFLVSLAVSLVQRVLRMGDHVSATLEKERAGPNASSVNPFLKYAVAKKPGDAGTLSPELAAKVSGVLLPSAVTLLEALIASSRLEQAMEPQQGVVCQCMGQAVSQMPVQGGVRFAAYRSMAVIVRYLKPDKAAAELGVPILPLLFNEALLALGNGHNLHPLNTKKDSSPGRRRGGPRQLYFAMRSPLNNGHGVKLHEDTVWAGVECLAVLILDCGLYLPPAQVAEVERVVTEGVELLVHRPLEVSPFNEDEPQMLRHASTREAFVRLVHYFLLLAEETKRDLGGNLYSEAKLAFHCHLQDPDGAVARECRVALTALKIDSLGASREGSTVKVLGDMEVDGDSFLHHSGHNEGGYTLEELENGEYHVVRMGPKTPHK